MLATMAGQLDIAIERFEVAHRLSPRARIGWPALWIGIVHFLSQRFDEAVPKLRLAIQEDPSLPVPRRYLAACYAHMGQVNEAREMIGQLRAFTADIMPNCPLPYRNPEHRELLLSGLRLAMGKET
jgi:adenylate cyclase